MTSYRVWQNACRLCGLQQQARGKFENFDNSAVKLQIGQIKCKSIPAKAGNCLSCKVLSGIIQKINENGIDLIWALIMWNMSGPVNRIKLHLPHNLPEENVVGKGCGAILLSPY